MKKIIIFLGLIIISSCNKNTTIEDYCNCYKVVGKPSQYTLICKSNCSPKDSISIILGTKDTIYNLGDDYCIR